MAKYDPEKRILLILGEWGIWHEPLTGFTPEFLYQQQTLRDALSVSTQHDTFHHPTLHHPNPIYENPHFPLFQSIFNLF